MSLRHHHSRIAAAITVFVVPSRVTAQQAVLAGTPIHQEADFTVSPQRVYDALITTKEFHAFSGMAATINGVAGGAFTIFDGHIMGRNVELVPGKRVVQAWRTTDWPAGIYSIARFELEARGSGTHLVFDQTGFPEAERASLTAGWESHYWALLKKYLH
jgi:activator of HSP90 ATPase